jgi:hypothetical protein
VHQVRTISIKALLNHMEQAERRWQKEDAAESDKPLTYEEWTQLRKGDKITVVRWTIGRDHVGRWWKRSEAYRATVTKAMQRGFTDLKGFWHCQADPGDYTRDLVATYLRHQVGEMVPNYTVNYKTVDGWSGITRTADMLTTQIYRGWSGPSGSDLEQPR